MLDNSAILEDRPLYKLLTRGLPSYQKTRVNGITRLHVRGIAKAISVTPAGIYKRFEPGSEQNTITIRMARKLIELSEQEIHKDPPIDFTPLTLKDFDPYLA